MDNLIAHINDTQTLTVSSKSERKFGNPLAYTNVSLRHKCQKYETIVISSGDETIGSRKEDGPLFFHSHKGNDTKPSFKFWQSDSSSLDHQSMETTACSGKNCHISKIKTRESRGDENWTPRQKKTRVLKNESLPQRRVTRTMARNEKKKVEQKTIESSTPIRVDLSGCRISKGSSLVFSPLSPIDGTLAEVERRRSDESSQQTFEINGTHEVGSGKVTSESNEIQQNLSDSKSISMDTTRSERCVGSRSTINNNPDECLYGTIPLIDRKTWLLPERIFTDCVGSQNCGGTAFEDKANVKFHERPHSIESGFNKSNDIDSSAMNSSGGNTTENVHSLENEGWNELKSQDSLHRCEGYYLSPNIVEELIESQLSLDGSREIKSTNFELQKSDGGNGEEEFESNGNQSWTIQITKRESHLYSPVIFDADRSYTNETRMAEEESLRHDGSRRLNGIKFRTESGDYTRLTGSKCQPLHKGNRKKLYSKEVALTRSTTFEQVQSSWELEPEISHESNFSKSQGGDSRWESQNDPLGTVTNCEVLAFTKSDLQNEEMYMNVPTYYNSSLPLTDSSFNGKAYSFTSQKEDDGFTSSSEITYCKQNSLLTSFHDRQPDISYYSPSTGWKYFKGEQLIGLSKAENGYVISTPNSEKFDIFLSDSYSEFGEDFSTDLFPDELGDEFIEVEHIRGNKEFCSSNKVTQLQFGEKGNSSQIEVKEVDSFGSDGGRSETAEEMCSEFELQTVKDTMNYLPVSHPIIKMVTLGEGRLDITASFDNLLIERNRWVTGAQFFNSPAKDERNNCKHYESRTYSPMTITGALSTYSLVSPHKETDYEFNENAEDFLCETLKRALKITETNQADDGSNTLAKINSFGYPKNYRTENAKNDLGTRVDSKAASRRENEGMDHLFMSDTLARVQTRSPHSGTLNYPDGNRSPTLPIGFELWMNTSVEEGEMHSQEERTCFKSSMILFLEFNYSGEKAEPPNKIKAATEPKVMGNHSPWRSKELENVRRKDNEGSEDWKTGEEKIENEQFKMNNISLDIENEDLFNPNVVAMNQKTCKFKTAELDNPNAQSNCCSPITGTQNQRKKINNPFLDPRHFISKEISIEDMKQELEDGSIDGDMKMANSKLSRISGRYTAEDKRVKKNWFQRIGQSKWQIEAFGRTNIIVGRYPWISKERNFESILDNNENESSKLDALQRTENDVQNVTVEFFSFPMLSKPENCESVNRDLEIGSLCGTAEADRCLFEDSRKRHEKLSIIDNVKSDRSENSERFDDSASLNTLNVTSANSGGLYNSSLLYDRDIQPSNKITNLLKKREGGYTETKGASKAFDEKISANIGRYNCTQDGRSESIEHVCKHSTHILDHNEVKQGVTCASSATIGETDYQCYEYNVGRKEDKTNMLECINEMKDYYGSELEVDSDLQMDNGLKSLTRSPDLFGTWSDEPPAHQCETNIESNYSQHFKGDKKVKMRNCENEKVEDMSKSVKWSSDAIVICNGYPPELIMPDVETKDGIHTRRNTQNPFDTGLTEYSENEMVQQGGTVNWPLDLCNVDTPLGLCRGAYKSYNQATVDGTPVPNNIQPVFEDVGNRSSEEVEGLSQRTDVGDFEELADERSVNLETHSKKRSSTEQTSVNSDNKENIEDEMGDVVLDLEHRITVPAGKGYRRSLSVMARRMSRATMSPSHMHAMVAKHRFSCQENVGKLGENGRSIVEVKEPHNDESTHHSSFSSINTATFLGTDESKTLFCHQRKSIITQTLEYGLIESKYKSLVMSLCNLNEVCTFQDVVRKSSLSNCTKIGEGLYGEVFLLSRQNEQITVLKIIPIEGSSLVNGEPQKTFEEVYSELAITHKLSELKGSSPCFAQLKNSWVVRGKYPSIFLKLWYEYKKKKGTDNDSPRMFKQNQLYLIMEIVYGGIDLEKYNFTSSSQAISILRQVSCGLAVGEVHCEFEHRDLHWGNILVAKTAEKHIQFTLKDKTYKFVTSGVKATIIDYTLSSMTLSNGERVYNDIGKDPDMFIATGDYQFDVYRLMKNELGNDWKLFKPKTNVLWLHYLVDKMVNRLHYDKKPVKRHKNFMANLRNVKKFILKYNKAEDVANYLLRQR